MIPKDAPEGAYTFTVYVTDESGYTTSRSIDVVLNKGDQNAPTIIIVTPNDLNKTVKIGDNLKIEAVISSIDPVDELEVELHGIKEYNFNFDELRGQKGELTFKTDLNITTNILPGTYDLHVTVKTTTGKETMGEFEGLVITK